MAPDDASARRAVSAPNTAPEPDAASARDAPALDPRLRFARPVTGPSYTASFKLVAVGLLASLAAYGARVLGAAPDPGGTAGLLAAAAPAILLASSWWVLFGTTTVDATGIRRSGWVRGQVRWEEIGRARYLRVPLSPRLVVITGSGPMRSFHAGNAALEQAFREIERVYRPGG